METIKVVEEEIQLSGIEVHKLNWNYQDLDSLILSKAKSLGLFDVQILKYADGISSENPLISRRALVSAKKRVYRLDVSELAPTPLNERKWYVRQRKNAISRTS